ncbi:MAG: cation diffusion facilitator family transporter [Methanomassiliicoccales archaeon]
MEKRQIASIVIIGGIVVFMLKLLAFFTSNSIALFSDALESIVNIAASIMMYIALVISEKPADENHHYGHKKAENISAFVEGVLIMIAATLIIEATVGRLFNPIEPGNLGISLVISLSASSLNGIMAFVMLKESRRSHSMALEGDSKHLFSDVLSSIGVVVGLFIAGLTGWYIIDPIIALIVAGLLIVMGANVLRKATVDLMDHNCPEEERKILETVSRFSGISDCHYIKTRRSGPLVYAEAHVCMKGDSTLSEADELRDRITEELEREIPGLTINIRIESIERGSKRKL